MKARHSRLTAAAAALVMAIGYAPAASAHCDTLDGPVVAAARMALLRGEITPVLKWVKKDAEPELRAAFQQTLTVRVANPKARELADRYFFETLVRLHRAGEGAPYTGLKPAGAQTEPAVEGADKALETGSIDAVIKLVTGDVAAGIRARFNRTVEARKQADASVEAGREFVEAYVDYIHYVEALTREHGCGILITEFTLERVRPLLAHASQAFDQGRRGIGHRDSPERNAAASRGSARIFAYRSSWIRRCPASFG